jgi:hypothetical protein
MFNQLNLLAEEIRQLRTALDAQSDAMREAMQTVLAISQAQTEVVLRLTAVQERLFLEAADPQLREPASGEAFAWAFAEDDFQA